MADDLVVMPLPSHHLKVSSRACSLFSFTARCFCYGMRGEQLLYLNRQKVRKRHTTEERSGFSSAVGVPDHLECSLSYEMYFASVNSVAALEP